MEDDSRPEEPSTTASSVPLRVSSVSPKVKGAHIVKAYTRGQGHPSLAHVVNGFKYRIFRTVLIVLGHMCMGIFVELAGPSLQDLKMRVEADYEEISRSLVARSVGYLLSSLCLGFLTDRLPQHVELLMALSFLFGVVGTGMTAWSSSLWLLSLAFHLQGWGMGSIDLCHNFLILRLWGKDSAPPMFSLHVGFGLGAFVAPQLARPFISAQPSTDLDVLDLTDNATFADNNTDVNPAGNESILINSTGNIMESRVEIPYMVSATYTLLYSIIYVFVYTYERYTIKRISGHVLTEDKPEGDSSIPHRRSLCRRLAKICSPGSCTGGRTSFGIVFFALMFLYYLNCVGGERAYGKFLYSFAVDGPLEFTKDQAANLGSVWWFCFMGGRAAAILYSKWLPTYIAIYLYLTSQITCAILLCIWGGSVDMVLWIVTGIFGFSLAPLYPAAMSWANLYVEMKGVAVSILIMGSATGAIIYQWLTGFIFEECGPSSFVYIMLGYAGIMAGVFVMLYCVTVRQGQRFDVIKLEEPEIVLLDQEDCSTGPSSPGEKDTEDVTVPQDTIQ